MGIVLGHVVLKVLENKEYNWIGLRNQVGANNKMKRMFMQFTPYSWVTFRATGFFFRIKFKGAGKV